MEGEAVAPKLSAAARIMQLEAELEVERKRLDRGSLVDFEYRQWSADRQGARVDRQREQVEGHRRGRECGNSGEAQGAVKAGRLTDP